MNLKTINTIHDTIRVVSESTNELKAYKLLTEVAQKAYEDQKDTLHWVITIVITFITVVLGAQYLFNFVINRRIIENLNGRIDSEVSNITNDYDAKINDGNFRLNDFQSRISQEIDSKFDAVHKRVYELEVKDFKGDYVSKAHFKYEMAKAYAVRGDYANAVEMFCSSAHILVEYSNPVLHILSSLFEFLKQHENNDKDKVDMIKRLIERVRTHYGTDEYKKVVNDFYELLNL